MSGTKQFSGPMEWCPGFNNMARAYQNTAPFMGAGTSTQRVKTALADKKFIEFWFETTATSGDNRAMYLQYYISGAGAGGECLRAYTRVNDVAASTAHGAHLSLGFETSGSITGLGAAVRGTLHVPTTGPTGGSYYGTYAEIWMDGNASSLAGVTEHAIIYCGVNGGNATARNTCKNAIAFKAEDGSTKLIYTHGHAEGNAAGSVRVLINGTAKYLKFWDAE